MYTSRVTRLIAALLLGLLVTGMISCKEEVKKPQTSVKKARVKIPKFDKDNAYALVEKQLSFGHRIPGNPEHEATKDWYVSQLEDAGAEVIVQPFKASFLGLEDQQAYNVIASFNPEQNNRVMLAAHWDSRLIAEKDDDPAKQDQPIMGADDGATGVAVLLEIASIIKENPIDLGVDIVLFDAEDQGDSDAESTTWCLGSQYWSTNPHKPNYKAKFGILLDMVGAKDAQFGREAFSETNAKPILDKVWSLAKGMGYTDYFRDYRSGPITDDHYYVMKNRGFPMIDIINTPKPQDSNVSDFGHYHHTHLDNIDIVSKRTLKVVGQVVTAVIYNESNGTF